MKIYTKSGDLGYTSLLGSRVKKSNYRIEIIGQLDELMVTLAMIIIEINPNKTNLINDLNNIYKNIFIIQSYIADELGKYNFNIDEDSIVKLEDCIDEMSMELPALKNFIFCTGHKTAVLSHQVRTKVRAVERLLVTLNDETLINPDILKYINRLSDYFFTLARHINMVENIEEQIIKI